MKLSVIMPAYMKEDVILDTLKRTEKSIKNLKIPYEIIVVDDGSKDRTKKKAMQHRSKHVRVLGYDQNRGKGGAIKYGYKSVTGDIVAFIDADNDLCPSQLKNFIMTMKDKNADVVVGSKLHPDSVVDYPYSRRLLSTGYRYFNKILFDLDVKDTQVGQKLFRKEVLDNIMPRVLVKRYAFDLELLVNAKHQGYNIVEAPIRLDYDFSGSRMDLKAVSNIFIDTCAIFYRLRLLKYYDKKHR